MSYVLFLWNVALFTEKSLLAAQIAKFSVAVNTSIPTRISVSFFMTHHKNVTVFDLRSSNPVSLVPWPGPMNQPAGNTYGKEKNMNLRYIQEKKRVPLTL